MPKIVDIKAYDGFERKTQRLGLKPVLEEVKQLITEFPFLLAETRRGNGAAVLREMLDARFAAVPGWTIVKSGGIDWTKCVHYNGAEVCMGVELQISARSDLLTNDLAHIMQAIEIGNIDVGRNDTDRNTGPFVGEICQAVDQLVVRKVIISPHSVFLLRRSCGRF